MTATAKQLREAADEFERLTAPDRVPTLDEVSRFVQSNRLTAVDLVLDLIFAGHLADGELSDGRFRELWKECGGSVDRQGRAFIEIRLLPRVLRFIIHAYPVAAHSSTSSGR